MICGIDLIHLEGRLNGWAARNLPRHGKAHVAWRWTISAIHNARHATTRELQNYYLRQALSHWREAVWLLTPAVVEGVSWRST